VSTWSGWVYVAFVVDAYARRILGWRTGTTMATRLVLDAVEQAIWTRARAGRTDLTGLVQHHDHGSQYVSLAYSERLAAASIQPSVGAVGSSFDNALAETINGLYKTELIKKQRPWRNVDHVELATAEWVDWFNTADSTNTAATSRPPKWKTLTTLRPEPSSPLRSQTAEPPDMPVRFTSLEDAPSGSATSLLFLHRKKVVTASYRE
jgi:hypothetical protein